VGGGLQLEDHCRNIDVEPLTSSCCAGLQAAHATKHLKCWEIPAHATKHLECSAHATRHLECWETVIMTENTSTRTLPPDCHSGFFSTCADKKQLEESIDDIIYELERRRLAL